VLVSCWLPQLVARIVSVVNVQMYFFIVLVSFNSAQLVYNATKITINPESLLDNRIFISGGFSYKLMLFFGGLKLQASICIRFVCGD
jgi:hypothetical protein